MVPASDEPPTDGPAGASPDDGPSAAGPVTDRSPRPGPLLDRTLAHVERLLPLALVPLLTALLNVEDLAATAETDTVVSVSASFPVYRYDLWSIIDPPGDGGASTSVPFDSVGPLALAVPLLGAYVVVSGALSAGYFGSIAEGITTGRFDFVANVRRFAVRLIALEALVVAAILLAVVPLAAFPPLLVFAVVALLVLSYLFFPTVYVLVLEDRGIESAIRRAYGLVTRHRPLWFFLALAAATALCSVPLSALAYSGPVPAVVAAVVAAPIALAFNVAAALKVAAMADVDAVR
ncbi:MULTISPECIES: hypothetical protein [unclassified Halorubrum]|uniref:hypothetical protein n=1 Tax=unclassified Halorubrum TaxID=2642239 RepID=UPI000BDAC3D3|nr:MULTISPECIES: hypothetical protein [unclassified Halorubrum]OYR41979.1 hypothetical protein DJ75_13475 [Halorubrum sp. Eb13]OYR44295.1 hypothetical protein DJ74_17845 [Halorubrum sp. Ea8]OYR45057.1 hypothetical protein DJ81_05670 [Halorubrum sp. Hd13]OYR54041.1 hypothetical protein DJ73_05920 [Halorubrum sp. Ea1]